MPEILKASEQNLNAVFSDAYLFYIPVYQRPYAWSTEHVDELLDDLLDAMRRDSTSPYFLGSIVLVKNEGNSQSDVVDGQQRLTTLSMLFCVLRELAVGDTQVALDAFVREAGNALRGTQDRFRLSLRSRDREFFHDNVQARGAIEQFLKIDTSSFSDSQELIFANVGHLRRELSKLNTISRESLGRFIIQQCYLVVVTATDRDSAYRIFSVMNDRGLNLSPTDILKAETIGKIADSDQDAYGEKWENIEESLGREDFRDLFSHIRMIKLKTKLRSTLQTDFQESVLKMIPGADFIDNILEPYATAYETIAKASYQSSQGAEKVNTYLRHLVRLDNFYWIPPAMEFFHRNPNSPDRLFRFTKDLERLAYGLFIQRANINERINRYADVLRVIEQGNDPWRDHGPLQLQPNEKAAILQRLDGPIYSPQSPVMRPLLLRLDNLLADSGATYEHGTISIEHVLPQNPAADSEWLTSFKDDEGRAQWTHRLSNLVLLSFRKNTRASNFGFDRKKSEYFQRGGVTSFALTTQVLAESVWTPTVLERRQRDLIDVLKKEWRLDTGGV